MSGRDLTFERAVALLARREHSQKELSRKLAQKGFAKEAIEQTLKKLILYDLQSDQRFAESYVRSRKLSGVGPRRIAIELSMRGVQDGLIDSAIYHEDNHWQAELTQVWEKKFDNKDQTVNKKTLEKEYRFLLQRGFDPEQIRRLLSSKKGHHRD